MRGHHVGAQRDIVAAAMPLIMLSGKKVFHIERLAVRDGEMFQVEIDPSSLFLSGIEVDGDEDEIARGDLAVAENMRAIGRMKVQRAVALQSGILAANLIEACDQGARL